MADRTQGGGRGGRGGSRGGARAPGQGGRGQQAQQERPKKEAILNLGKYVDQRLRVKFAGGREAIGVLKGYDQLMNLVLDDVEEILHDPETGNTTDQRRSLGLAVLRGPTITLVSPADGMEMIANPFTQAE